MGSLGREETGGPLQGPSESRQQMNQAGEAKIAVTTYKSVHPFPCMLTCTDATCIANASQVTYLGNILTVSQVHIQ